MRGLFTCIGALAVAAPCLGAPALAAEAEVTFLLVNDIDQMTDMDGRGGYPKIAAVAKAERESGKHVIFVHAGDAISPSLMSGFDQGAHIITLLNMAGPDVFVPGNHEFDFGPEIFRKRMSEATFPLLAANLRDASDQRLPGFEDSRIFEFDGVTVGVVGLTSEDAFIKSSPGDLKIAPLLATGIEQAGKLRAEGADLVVGVAHAARSADRALFDSRAFDLILSGDDHDLNILFDGRTVLMESLAQGEYVAAVDVRVQTREAEGEHANWQPEFRVIDTAVIDPDPAVQARADGFQAELSKELEVVIGRTMTELDSRRATVRTGEAAMGNLIADAMRETVSADVALMNSGGIRADRVYPPGTEITRKDILAELPFGNRVVKLEATGAVLQASVEHGLSQIEDGAGRFPQVSGMTIRADLSAPVGSRVTSIEVGGAPLDPARTYTFAVTDFTARGGDGYDMLAGLPHILGERDGPLLAAAVMAHIRKRGEIAPVVEKRIETTG